jgi:uncharacterized protein (DUF608 family)
VTTEGHNRRRFLKQLGLSGLGVTTVPGFLSGRDRDEKAPVAIESASLPPGDDAAAGHLFNEDYLGACLTRVAFPVGGMGAGMFCVEGTGAISHVSVRHRPELFHEPVIFAAVSVKGLAHGAKVLEGPVPDYKKFGMRGAGNGAAGTTYGLPRFTSAAFRSRFPFAEVRLTDPEMPLDVAITAWSPFTPGDADDSSLPVAGLEYRFTNTGTKKLEAVFSYHARNFMAEGTGGDGIDAMAKGFVLRQSADVAKPSREGRFAVFMPWEDPLADYCWFRGGWWDPLTVTWETIRDARTVARDPVPSGAPGASLYVPFTLAGGATRVIRVLTGWYVPDSDIRTGKDATAEELARKQHCDPASGCCTSPSELGLPYSDHYDSPYYKPWYSGRFQDIGAVTDYWTRHYERLSRRSLLFRDAFYESTLPPEVIEAVAANLSILKSPTVLRQTDGRLWAYEGCSDDRGCCDGSCTHVWNYAQALPHLFSELERSLRYTEFCEDQSAEGHQTFRADLPIRPLSHGFYAAADGQLGGIMKVYREWRILGDTGWLKKMLPMVKKSLDYCISTWDPKGRGRLEEPHHNTYDIEFWGPDGMCTSFYLGALTAFIRMAKATGEDVSRYEALYRSGKRYLEEELFNGEYFFQRVTYQGLEATDPATAAGKSFGGAYSPEALALLKKEGPKYQYGTGCLSDGILGAWIGAMCGVPGFVDPAKTRSHLTAVHRYNLKNNLTDHANPQRPSYALGSEGGLLLCTWPRGGRPELPFVYSDEVWTGIEYQVASHLMLSGEVEKGLEIVRACRRRYDGRVRNPFNEYECGSWYARALSSYGLLQGLTGVRYDAVDQVLYIDSRVGDFTSFLATATGFGTVGLRDGRPFLKVAHGRIAPREVRVSGRRAELAG